MSQVDGLVVIDKPTGCTSHDVVARCRRIFGQKKVGHAGTLDPDATGVLLVGLGQATRLLQWLTGLPKRYTGEVVLGIATTTLDAGGEVTGTWDMSAVTSEARSGAAARLTGEITQVPPMVSALKVGGRRLHELARDGVEVERALPRPRDGAALRRRVAGRLAARRAERPVLAIDVECSSGTYVRSLAADLGTLLGGGAHLRNLRRTAVGDFLGGAGRDAGGAGGVADGSEAVLAPAAALPGMARAVVEPGAGRSCAQREDAAGRRARRGGAARAGAMGGVERGRPAARRLPGAWGGASEAGGCPGMSAGNSRQLLEP